MAIAESREFFLRHEEVNEGAFRDIEAHFPLTSYVKELVVADDGSLSVKTVLRYNRLLENDKPTPQVIEKLITSICFKLNPNDSATTSQAGLVKLATRAQMDAGLKVDDFGFTLIYDPSYLLEKQVPEEVLDRIKALEDSDVTIDNRLDDLENKPELEPYVLPISTPETLGGVKPDNVTIVVDAEGIMSANIEESLFKVPTGFTKITNELGDVNNTKIPNIATLNNMKSVDILKKILFPTPKIPNFIQPVTTLSITPSNLLVEIGENVTLGLTETFTSSDNSVIKIENSTIYTKDNSVFTKGSPLVFTAPSIIKVSISYQANPNYELIMDDGSIVHTTDLIGYPTDSNLRKVNAQKTITPVKPLWVGCLDNITNPSTITANQLATLLTAKKLLQTTYSSTNLLISSYTGAYNDSKKIICVSPIPVKTITYTQNMNIDVLAAGVFTKRENQIYNLSNGTTTKMHIYYANNPYNANEVVNYVFNF